MKIIKIFGAVIALHLLAFVVIFANPGCTSSNAASPSAESDGVAAEPPDLKEIIPVSMPPPTFAAAINFDPNAPAVPPGRYSPTRPSEQPAPTPSQPATATPAAIAPAAAAPVQSASPEAANGASSEPITYTVVAGDSLWSVSKRYGISFSELAAANGIPSNSGLRLGQRLTIPPRRTADQAAPAASAAQADGGHVHVVLSGETLSAIAQRYGVRLAELQQANRIANSDLIRPGMELVIPGWQATSQQAPAASTAAPAASASAPPAPSTVPTVPRLPPAAEIPVIRLEGLNAP